MGTFETNLDVVPSLQDGWHHRNLPANCESQGVDHHDVLIVLSCLVNPRLVGKGTRKAPGLLTRSFDILT